MTYDLGNDFVLLNLMFQFFLVIIFVIIF